MKMDRAVDILHPLASLEWRECKRPPALDIGSTAQAVWLKDRVYVGRGWMQILRSRRDDARLYIYNPIADTWDTPIDTPVFWFALTSYHSHLVLVGGSEYIDENVHGEPTNKLWTLSEGGQWQETLPPLPSQRCSIRRGPLSYLGASAVSHGDLLLVVHAEIHMYNGHHWATVKYPSREVYFNKSTVFNGHWYLMGRESGNLSKTYVYSASVDSLLASCQSSETSQPSSLWKRLTDVPTNCCYPAVFGNRLVAVGGSSSTITSLHVYSSFTQSWVHIGDAPVTSSIDTPCTVVLPSNELMVVRAQTTFKFALKMTPFNPESSFNVKAISLLEAAGIPVKRTLSYYTRHIQNILGLTAIPTLQLSTLLSLWIGSDALQVPPVWKNLLLIIRLINLDDLAQRMESYLSGATEEPHESPEGEVEEVTEEEESGEVEPKLLLREQTIYHLKQEMASLREEKDATIFTLEEKIKEQISEIEKLRSRSSLEGEEKPVLLLPLKSEVKEESVMMTKVETMSAQLTTGMSSHSITAIVCGASYMSTATWNLRGVEVCGEMTVVVYSSHDQQITWSGYGLRLHIPKGCLPAGMEQCTINIKASLSGQYEFPENSHLVSAIFWLRCEDVHKFAIPITVEIQHCAKSENVSNQLSFVRAVCSQRQLPYTFKHLPGGNFTSHSCYGVIELNSFSGVGATQEGSEDREYYSQLFYLGQPNLCKIHYVVTWNTEAHLTVVKDEYTRKGAVLGLDQPVEFEADATCITLDIPMEGIAVQGWKITPLIRPVVTKKQVDSFKEGKGTPRCQLLAEVSSRKKKLPSLRHQVSLKGAKYPNNVFTLNLPVEDTSSYEGSQILFGDLITGPPPSKRSRLEGDLSPKKLPQTSKTSTNDESTKPKLKDLQRELYSTVANEWEDIGIQLDIEEGQLKQIKSDNAGDSKACLREMLRAWLSRVAPPPSWSAMADALNVLGRENIATHLRTKYCQ